MAVEQFSHQLLGHAHALKYDIGLYPYLLAGRAQVRVEQLYCLWEQPFLQESDVLIQMGLSDVCSVEVIDYRQHLRQVLLKLLLLLSLLEGFLLEEPAQDGLHFLKVLQNDIRVPSNMAMSKYAAKALEHILHSLYRYSLVV